MLKNSTEHAEQLFLTLFEQKIQIWSKIVMPKVVMQCTDMKFISITCNTCEVEKKS